MNTLDAHGVLRSAILRGGHGAKKSGKVLSFRCPRHNDSHASAWLGDHAWGCMACGFTDPLRTLADILNVTLPDEEKASHGLTVQEYAERKGLALTTLTAAKVRDEQGQYGESLVAIPYFNAKGELLRTKARTRNRTFWFSDGTGTPLYGQWMLAQLEGPVLLVEGESDCHAAWQRGVCAVGLPGASMWKPEFSPILDGREVVVWQEPDEGGATMVAKVQVSLPKAKVLRNVEYRGQQVKDFCDLHQAVQAHGDDFASVWRTVLLQATQIGAEPPVVTFDSMSGPTLDHLLEQKLKPVDAVPTMLDVWNSVCRGAGGAKGIARSWVVTIGALTGHGKSNVALNLAAHAAEQGEVVSYISLEMGRDELMTRLLSVQSGEHVNHLEQGPDFNRDAYLRAQRYADDLKRRSGGEVLINRRPIYRLQDVVSSIKYNVETLGSRYIIVDYVQLVATASRDSINERTELVSHQLRELAQKHNVVMIMLSQFNRETSKMRGERPISQGLMGGSALENDSHMIALFDHSRYTRTGPDAETWLIIDKNRNGAVVDIPVAWDYRTLRLKPRIPSISEQEEEHGYMLPKWKERN